MSVKRAFNERRQFFDSNGAPLNGGQAFWYASGSSTKQNTFNASDGAVANANPMILDSGGFFQSEVWLTVGETYKLVVTDSTDSDPPSAPDWTEDVIQGMNDATLTIDQWISGPAPTYVSATQFTLVGDQTSEFHVGRRLKSTNTGGTIYSEITVAAYTSLTTITVVNDSGTLDSGLSAVSYGLISATNTSTPVRNIKFPATQVASSDVNTLDDYKKGTWTPLLTDGTLDDEGQTGTFVGTYTKTGNKVFIECRIDMTGLGSMTAGNLAFITGLPYTAHNVTGLDGCFSVSNAQGLAITAGHSMSAHVTYNTNYIALNVWDATTGTSGMLISEVSADGSFSLSGNYTV